MLLSGPSDFSGQTQIKEPLRLAISPLAVHTLISSLAVALFLCASAFEPNLTSILLFVGVVSRGRLEAWKRRPEPVKKALFFLIEYFDDTLCITF